MVPIHVQMQVRASGTERLFPAGFGRWDWYLLAIRDALIVSDPRPVIVAMDCRPSESDPVQFRLPISDGSQALTRGGIKPRPDADADIAAFQSDSRAHRRR